MPSTHSNLAGERVVIILEGGRVINGTITSFQFDSDPVEITRGPEMIGDDPSQWYPGDRYRTFVPGPHRTTLTVDAEL